MLNQLISAARIWIVRLIFLAASPAVFAQFSYTTNGGAITLTGYTGSGGAIAISNFVTSIGENSFKNHANLTSVTIPASVTNIGDYAFFNCSRLTRVAIPNGITSIGGYTFRGCSGLTNVALPADLSSIGPGAFYLCIGLSNIVIPDSIQSIGNEAFLYCSNLVSVYFQGNVPSVPAGVLPEYITVYYLPGVTNLISFPPESISYRPAFFAEDLWALPYPLVLDRNANFGPQSNRFGFTVSWATNRSVVVEACADLANPVWQPVQTNTLTNTWNGGSFYFSDSRWTNYPQRFYRIRAQ